MLLRPIYRLYEERLLRQMDPQRLPRHIGIILDGHRRYARAEGLADYEASYRVGMRKFEEFLGWAQQIDLPAITGWLLSKENLARPAEELQPDFEVLKPSVAKVLEILLEDHELTLVNVNFPDIEPKGLRWTRQSVRRYDGKVVPGEDPMGRKHYWFSVIPIEGTEKGTDRWAVEQGYVSLTPLRLDLTNEKELAAAAARQFRIERNWCALADGDAQAAIAAHAVFLVHDGRTR